MSLDQIGDDAFGTSLDDDSFDLDELDNEEAQYVPNKNHSYSHLRREIREVDASHLHSEELSDSEYWINRGME